MKWNDDWQENAHRGSGGGPIAIGEIVPAVLARYGLAGYLSGKRAASPHAAAVSAAPDPPETPEVMTSERGALIEV